MRLTWDEAKRARTLDERGLDFADAAQVFTGSVYTEEDTRFDYGERRMLTVGHYDGRMVILIWAGDDVERRIISMRKANEREQRTYRQRLG